MGNFVSYDRDQAFLLPPDLKEWLPEDYLAHFLIAAVERATSRDIGMRFVAANTHPDHDTIATFRPSNIAAVEAAFLQVFLLTEEAGLLRVGTVAIDGIKIDANASQIKAIR